MRHAPLLVTLLSVASFCMACQDDRQPMGLDWMGSGVTASLSVSSSEADVHASLTGSRTARYDGVACSFDQGPIIIEGSIDLTSLPPNGAALVGLIDKAFYEAHATSTWFSGAYAYFGHIGTDNLRVGPSDGFLGGELNQVGANVPLTQGSTHDFRLEVYSDGQVGVTYGGNTYWDDYGEIEAFNSTLAYLHSEFDFGAILGVDIWPMDVDVTYRLRVVQGCTSLVTDDEGPSTISVAVTPNPAAAGSDLVLMAMVDDTETGGSNIASAEYSWQGLGGPWAGMDAVDGVFDGVSEDVTAVFTTPAEPGVYDLCVQGTDDAGNTGGAACISLAVFDPAGGFVTGGGWIEAPSVSFSSDFVPTSVWDRPPGKGRFGLVAKYKKGAQIPDGTTEFHVADLNFHSTAYEWLLVTGDGRAELKGIGQVNGNGEYGFQVWAGDGDPDTFRIRIWQTVEQSEIVLFDTGVDQPISGGSIVVHGKRPSRSRPPRTRGDGRG